MEKKVFVIGIIILILIILIWGMIGKYVTKDRVTENFSFYNYKCDFGIKSSEDKDFDGENDAYLCWIWHQEELQELSQEKKDEIKDLFG